MDFRLVKMQVNNLAFSDEFQGDEKDDSQLKIDATLMFSDAGDKLANMLTEIILKSPGRYEFECKLSFIFKFDNQDVTADEAKELLEKADTERLLFPYIHSFLTNFIMTAGYPRPGIPLVLV